MSKAGFLWLLAILMSLSVHCHANHVPEVEEKGSTPTVQCVKKKQYYVNGTCERCARPRDCPDGQKLNKTYPVQMGDHGAENCRPCVPCPAGTYKNRRTQGQCVWETDCLDIGRGFIVHTDGTQDSECSSECRQGWFKSELDECIECTVAYKNQPGCKGIFTTEAPTTFTSVDEKRSSETDDDVVVATKEPLPIPEGYENPHHQSFEYLIVAVVIVIVVAIMIVVRIGYKRWKRHRFMPVPTNVHSTSSVRSTKLLISSSTGNDIETDSAPVAGHIKFEVVLYNGEKKEESEVNMEEEDYLNPSEEEWCKKIKLIEECGNPYLRIVSTRSNRSMEPLFIELKIQQYEAFHISENCKEKGFKEYIYQCLLVWLTKSGRPLTVYDLYFALKKSRYNTILKNDFIKMIRQNMNNAL